MRSLGSQGTNLHWALRCLYLEGRNGVTNVTWPLSSSFHCDSEMVVPHGPLFGRRGLPSAARLLRLVLQQRQQSQNYQGKYGQSTLNSTALASCNPPPSFHPAPKREGYVMSVKHCPRNAPLWLGPCEKPVSQHQPPFQIYGVTTGGGIPYLSRAPSSFTGQFKARVSELTVPCIKPAWPDHTSWWLTEIDYLPPRRRFSQAEVSNWSL